MIKSTPHHIGCAVSDLATSCETYSAAFGLRRRTRELDVSSQRVRVRFLELQAGFYLELVMPLGDEAKLRRYLKQGFYHLCFLVDDLSASREWLRARNYGPLPPFSSEAFAGAPCQFLVSPQRHLIELAQIRPDEFAAFFEGNLDVAASPRS